MYQRILLGMTFTLAAAVFQASALAQAAAEAALVKAGTATATAKSGAALSSTLNRSSKQLAGRVQQTVQPVAGKTSPAGARPVSATPAKGTPVPEGTTPGQGPVIASIQGGVASCASTRPAASTPESKGAAESSAPESGQTNCKGQDAANKPAPQKYQSVITVSFSK